MDKSKIDKMSGTFSGHPEAQYADRTLDQQLGQMYELMQQIKNQAQEDANAEDERVINLLDKKSPTEQ
jgi:hypothetical protein